MNNHWALVIKLGFRVYYLTLYSYIYIYIHAYIYIYTYVHIYNMVLYGDNKVSITHILKIPLLEASDFRIRGA